MTRIAALLLLIGGVLLVSWAIAPAAPVQQTPERGASASTSTLAAPDLAADVDRLRARLATERSYPPPARDPFRYGRRESAERPETTPEVAPPVDSAPPLPRLLAILADAKDGMKVWTAVIASGRDVQIVKTGDVVGAYRIQQISADAVELVETASLRAVRLPLK